MHSTGEVMGHASHFGHAFAKSQVAAGMALPESGAVLITVNDFDKSAGLKFARDMSRLGFSLYATPGTADMCTRAGMKVEVVEKARAQLRIKGAVAAAEQRGFPEWLEVDPKGMKGVFKAQVRGLAPTNVTTGAVVSSTVTVVARLIEKSN